MGICVEKIGCDDCGSSSGRQVFFDEEKESYYSICFSGCGGEAKGSPYSDQEGREPPKPKTPEEIYEEVQELRTCKVFDQDFRGIPKAQFASWSVRLLVSEHDGKTPYAVAFPYSNEAQISGWKIATMQKKSFWAVGDTKGSDPFGFERAMKLGGKTLYITEGEYDAIAADYCLVKAQEGTKHGRKRYPVVSLPAGAGSVAATLKKILQRVKERGFKNIAFIMDQDEAGILAEKVAHKVLPKMMQRVAVPSGCKDPNDALKNGKYMAAAFITFRNIWLPRNKCRIT